MKFTILGKDKDPAKAIRDVRGNLMQKTETYTVRISCGLVLGPNKKCVTTLEHNNFEEK